MSFTSSSPRHPAYSSYQTPRRRNPFSSSHFGSDIDIDDEGTVDKPVLAINCKGKSVGAAFWKPEDTTVVILGDIACANPLDMIDLGKEEMTWIWDDDSEITELSRDYPCFLKS